MRYETNRAYVEREYPFIVFGEDAMALEEIAINLRTGDVTPDYIDNGNGNPYTQVHKGWGGKWVLNHGYDTAVITGHCKYIFGNIKLPCAITDPWLDKTRLVYGKALSLIRRNRYSEAFSMLAKAAKEFRNELRGYIDKVVSESAELQARYKEWSTRQKAPLTVEQLLSNKRVA